MTTSTAITMASHAFEPGSAQEALALAKVLVAGRLMPKSVATPEAAFTIIMTGRELGLTAMQSLRSIHVIEGKAVMSADLMLALVKRSPECEYVRLVESTAEVATYEAKRRGEPAATKMSFTIAEAQAAGLATKDNWKKFPAAMLRARCIAALVRAVFPDVLLGVYEQDELMVQQASAPTALHATVVTADGEVVPMAPPAPPSGAEPVADVLLARINAATTLAEIQAVSLDVGRAVKLGALDKEQRDAIAAAGKAKKATLAAVPPSAPDASEAAQ